MSPKKVRASLGSFLRDLPPEGDEGQPPVSGNPFNPIKQALEGVKQLGEVRNELKEEVVNETTGSPEDGAQAGSLLSGVATLIKALDQGPVLREAYDRASEAERQLMESSLSQLRDKVDGLVVQLRPGAGQPPPQPPQEPRSAASEVESLMTVLEKFGVIHKGNDGNNSKSVVAEFEEFVNTGERFKNLFKGETVNPERFYVNLGGEDGTNALPIDDWKTVRRELREERREDREEDRKEERAKWMREGIEGLLGAFGGFRQVQELIRNNPELAARLRAAAENPQGGEEAADETETPPQEELSRRECSECGSKFAVPAGLVQGDVHCLKCGGVTQAVKAEPEAQPAAAATSGQDGS